MHKQNTTENITFAQVFVGSNNYAGKQAACRGMLGKQFDGVHWLIICDIYGV